MSNDILLIDMSRIMINKKDDRIKFLEILAKIKDLVVSGDLQKENIVEVRLLNTDHDRIDEKIQRYFGEQNICIEALPWHNRKNYFSISLNITDDISSIVTNFFKALNAANDKGPVLTEQYMKEVFDMNKYPTYPDIANLTNFSPVLRRADENTSNISADGRRGPEYKPFLEKLKNVEESRTKVADSAQSWINDFIIDFQNSESLQYIRRASLMDAPYFERIYLCLEFII